MKTILKTSLASVIASAYILSFAGCIDDRTDFGKNSIIAPGESGGVVVDPNGDDDDDNLTNQEESDLGTLPDNPDSDDDGLDDGLEHRIIGTSPLNSDSDNDGVTDGIEVVGTYEGDETITDDGNIITADHKYYTIEDGVLKLDKPISIADFEGKTPANIHKNKFTDPEDKIDALDSMNDSDFDTKQNKTEKDDSTNPLNTKDRAKWIYETPKGVIMEKAGFVYIPGGFDVDGFGIENGYWMATREARSTATTVSGVMDIDFVVNTFTIFNAEGKPSGLDAINSDSPLVKVEFNTTGVKKSDVYPFEAAFMIEKSSPVNGWSTTLPTDKQWTHMVKLMINHVDNWSGAVGVGSLKSSGVYALENSILGYDKSVEEEYKRVLHEVADGNAEWTRTLIEKDIPIAGMTDFIGLKELNILPDWWLPSLNNVILGRTTKIGIYINIAGRFESDDTPSSYIVMTRGGSDNEVLAEDDNGIATVDFGYGLYFKNKNIGFRAASDYLDK